jgi:hypothetical protein
METCDTFTDGPSLVLYFGDSGQSTPTANCPDELWPLPPAMVHLFEQITGWVLQFDEFPASFHQRRVILGSRSNSRASVNNGSALQNLSDPDSLDPLPIAEGRFRIVDMSAHWPAGRPTSHRGKCDQFVDWLNEFLSKVYTDGRKLRQAKSILAATAIAPQVVTDDESLEDSFSARHRYETLSETEQDFVMGNVWMDSTRNNTLDDLQMLVNNVDEMLADQYPAEPRKLARSKTATLPHPQADNWNVTGFSAIPNWRIGGRRGMLGSRFIDWNIKDDGRIELINGDTRGSLSWNAPAENPAVCDATLSLNPATEKFWVSGDSTKSFWIFDSNTQSLNRVPDKVCTLQRGESVVVSTAGKLNRAQTTIQLPTNLRSDKPDQLAKAIQEFVGTSEPVLVLSRIN